MQSSAHPPTHVAIIMDGNGRWAAQRGLPRIAGHRAGAAALRRAVEHAPDLGIRCLTLFAFSSDNWRRPADEVRRIFWVMRAYLRTESENLKQRGARLEVIGRRDRLPEQLLCEIERAEQATYGGSTLHVRVAIDYSSRDSITRAAVDVSRTMSRDRPPSQELLGRMLTHRMTAESGNVDLLIRTGGEKRLSDFLLWELAYAELHFTDCMWPDFDDAEFDAAVREFGRRERRFGGVPALVAERPAISLGGVR